MTTPAGIPGTLITCAEWSAVTDRDIIENYLTAHDPRMIQLRVGTTYISVQRELVLKYASPPDG